MSNSPALTEAVREHVARVLHASIDSLRTFARWLKERPLEERPMSGLRHAWDAHYYQAFSRLDRMLLDRTREGRDPPQALLALSVSHHNLHRLVEVLELELDTQVLGRTRTPERLADLLEAASRLCVLHEEALDSAVWVI